MSVSEDTDYMRSPRLEKPDSVLLHSASLMYLIFAGGAKFYMPDGSVEGPPAFITPEMCRDAAARLSKLSEAAGRL